MINRLQASLIVPAVAAALLSATFLGGCKKQASLADAQAAETSGNTAAPQRSLVIDTVAPDRKGLNVVSGEGKKLAAAAPDSGGAVMDSLHRAVAYVQTGRLDELPPLLTPAAQKQLAKAGGNKLLTQYRSARVEFADATALDANRMAARQRFRLHLITGENDSIRIGEALLRRDSGASAWRIDSVRLEPASNAPSRSPS